MSARATLLVVQVLRPNGTFTELGVENVTVSADCSTFDARGGISGSVARRQMRRVAGEL